MWREHDSVYKCQNPGSNSDSHSCGLGKARRCHWGWIFIWWEKSSNFYKYIYMKKTEKLIHWPQGRHAPDMWPRARHGWVSCPRTLSPPGCCCPGGPHWTGPGPGSSPPPRVRCLPWWGLTTRRRSVITNNLCTTRLMSLLKIRIQRMFEYLCIPDLRCLGVLCYVYYNIATFGLYSLQKLETMNEYYERELRHCYRNVFFSYWPCAGPLPWLGVFKYINQCHCTGWGYLNI